MYVIISGCVKHLGNYKESDRYDNDNDIQLFGKHCLNNIDNSTDVISEMFPHSEKSPARPMLFFSTNYWHQF